MKYVAMIIMCLLLASCGNTSINNEAIGQVKKVRHETPLVCPNYTDTDVSLGVMRNGVGSMSTEDLWFTVADQSQLDALNKAAQTGELVKINYNVKRVTFCIPDHVINKVEFIH